MNIITVRFFLALTIGLLILSMRKVQAQNIHYQLVDLEMNTQPEDTINILDSLGAFSKPVRLFVDGIHITSRDKRFSIGNSGFWSTVPVYNFVDGFWVGQTFNSKMYFNDKHKLELEAMIYYTTARKKLTWQTDLSYLYLPHLVGKLKLSGGNIMSDYDSEEHLARLENSLYSLTVGHNYMKLFKKKFVEIKNSFYPFPGFRLFSSFSVQWRSSEVNRITYSFIHPGKDFDQSNIPLNKHYRLMPESFALVGSVGFDFTICKACIYNQNTNEIIYSYIPTVSARTVFGIPAGKENRSKFQYIEGSLNQRFRFTKRTTLDYKLGGGTFIYSQNLWFPDFKHFGAYSLPSMRTFSDDGYFLIGYYKADTNKSWLKGSANFLSERFLLTRLKFLANDQFSEGVHARYLWTPEIRHYTEWGYAFGYKDLVRLGCFIGFTGVRYSNFGVTLSFPWLTGGY
ncbi:MAG: DUF5686 family protein [Bacteroidales bacterium]